MKTQKCRTNRRGGAVGCKEKQHLHSNPHVPTNIVTPRGSQAPSLAGGSLQDSEQQRSAPVSDGGHMTFRKSAK